MSDTESEPRAMSLSPSSPEDLPVLPWSYARQYLETARHYWIATTRPDGRSHVTPVWGVWLDNAFVWAGSPSSRWARNLAANPEVSLHLECGAEVVIVEGTAAPLANDETAIASFMAAWNDKYGMTGSDAGPMHVVRLTPQRARGWSHTVHASPARWEF